MGVKMDFSTLLKFDTPEIVTVSVFGAILLGIVIYYCFVPMKNFFTALFSGAYIPSFKLLSIKNRKLNVSEVVGAYVMAKKSKQNIKLNEIESLILAGGDAKAVIGAMNLAKNADISLGFELACAIELSNHNVMQVVADAINTRVVVIDDICAFTQDKIELIIRANVSVRANLARFIDGLGIDELKSTISAWFLEVVSRTENHQNILKQPNRSLLKGLDLEVIANRSRYSVLDINVTSVVTGRDLNAELEIQATEKEKIQAEIEAERMKYSEEMRELRARTKTEAMKSEVLEAEKQIPLAISDAIKEGRFSIMDYYKLMNLQADTALRRAFVKDNKNDSDEGDF